MDRTLAGGQVVMVSVILVGLIVLVLHPAVGGQEGLTAGDWPTAQGDAARAGVRGTWAGAGTGDLLWRFDTGGLSVTGAAVSGDTAFFGSSDGHVYAVSWRDGRLVWKTDLEKDVRPPPVVSDGVVYALTADGRIHALDSATGILTWSSEGVRPSLWAPTVHEGSIFYIGDDGRLYAVETRSGNQTWRVDSEHRFRGSPLVMDDRLILSRGHGVAAVNPENGEILWVSPLPLASTGSVASDGRTIFTTVGAGSLYALDAGDATVVWEHQGGSRAWRSPSVRDGVVYYTETGTLNAVDSSNGQFLWSVDHRTGGAENVAVAPDAVFAVDLEGTVRAFGRSDGTLLWAREIAAFVRTSPVAVDGVLLSGSEQFSFYALDAGAGSPIGGGRDQPEAESSPSFSIALLLLMVLAVLCSIGRSGGRTRS